MSASIHPPDVYVPPRPRSEENYRRAYAHANARLRERYHLDLSFEEYVQLCHDLADTPFHQLQKVNTRSRPSADDRVIVNIRVQGMATRAVWSLRTGVIVSWVMYQSLKAINVEAVERNWQQRKQQRQRRRYCRHAKHRGEL